MNRFVLARGAMLIAESVLVVVAELLDSLPLKVFAGGIGAVYLLLVFFEVRWSRRAFVILAAILSAGALLWRDDGVSIVADAFVSAGFILAFFVSLSTLRTAAGSSGSIRRCGLYLATRTPGKRYLALAAGGHLFSLVLNYGSISLLGTLVEQAETGPDGKPLNAVRLRRMLLAIQRGFASTLCWSPLAFSMAVGSTLVPGGSWGGAAGYGIASAVMLTLLGWGVDALFKPPRPPNAPPPPDPVGSFRSLLPLLILLFAIVVCIAGVRAVTGLKVIMAVMAVVPVVSVAWIAAQTALPTPPEPRPSASAVATEVLCRCRDYLAREVDSYRGEVVLLYMAGFIGKLGGSLAAPLVSAHLLDLSAVPGWAFLVGMVVGVPLLGQVGMHPILAASLIGPLLPAPEVLGIPPDILVVALAIGWSFSAVSSPFTATVLLIGVFGKVPALTVGVKWNGAFLLVGAVAASLWVLGLAALAG